MKILYIAAECKPFSKAGGVADVAGELPVALKAEGVDIEIVTPWYGKVSVDDYAVDFHGVRERVGVVRTDLKGVPVHFVKSPTYFETDYSAARSKPPFSDPNLFKRDYSTPYVDSAQIPFYDDALRFSFFSEACLNVIERRKPDIVHINDWVLGYLFGRMAMKGMPNKKVLTIHNIGYQGNLGRGVIRGWNIEQIANDETLGPLFADPHSHWDSVNPLRLAMELADCTNTVSPNYKAEITRPEDSNRYFEGGKGLDSVAARLDAKGALHGILNGFEYRFEPGDKNFESVMAEKAQMKAALSKKFANPGNLLLGFVGRAVEQKFKLLTESLDGRSVIEHILDIPRVNVAVVATGLPEYENVLRRLQGRNNFAATIAFDRTIAQQISLGSDVFLMPSLFEPCGITQMESLSCATPPLVRWTGGLVDTVTAHTDESGTGFGFDGTTAREVLTNLLSAVTTAVSIYSETPEKFRRMQRCGFNQRFLWQTSAKEYIANLYKPLLSSG